MLKRFSADIFGKVQGVWFRQSAMEVARKLNIVGWIENTVNNTVYIEAEGDLEKLNNLIRWLKKGPPDAKVNRVDARWIKILEVEKCFLIR